MDNAFRFSMSQVLAAIGEAEVISIFFPILGQALVVDIRHDAIEGPFTGLVPMVPTVEERLRSLERLRPRFGRPEGLLAIPWQRRVEGLRDYGVLERIADRLERAGAQDARRKCEDAFQRLSAAEKAEMMAAIRGEGYRALWERRR